MGISLSQAEVLSILPKVNRGLQKYLLLQSMIANSGEFHADPVFRRRFNGFYRVRCGLEWQNHFYNLMGRAKGWSFTRVLAELSLATGRLEASFSSKLVASLDPSFPVIDTFVLNNVGLKLPAPGRPDRARRVNEIYGELRRVYAEFLESVAGRTLVQEFRRYYPTANVTELKMLDLVLWQKRR
jgi:hypothetical protein